MVSVSYPSRLLLDYDFLKWLVGNEHKSRAITALLHIHNSSKNKKRQNFILKKDFDKILVEGLIKDKDIIKGCLFSFAFPEEIEKIFIEKQFDEIAQRGILGIVLSNEPPCKVTILTTKENLDKYNKHPVFEKLKDVSIKDETEGIQIINNYYRTFCFERELHR